MNTKQEKLFDLINDNGFDMEDLIDRISYVEVDKLIETFEELVKEIKINKLLGSFMVSDYHKTLLRAMKED